MRVQHGRLRHNLHEAAEMSTTQILMNDACDDRPLLKRLEHKISLLEELTTQALLEKEALLEERKRALAVLGKADVIGMKLDIEVSYYALVIEHALTRARRPYNGVDKHTRTRKQAHDRQTHIHAPANKLGEAHTDTHTHMPVILQFVKLGECREPCRSRTLRENAIH